MKTGKHMTAFYVETVLMAIIFVLVITILAQVFSTAKIHSHEAQQMTNAVCLAQNAAEAVAMADSEKELRQLLDENGTVAKGGTADADAVLTAYYNGEMKPVTEKEAVMDARALRLEATWKEEASETAGVGSFVTSDISVYDVAEKEPIYTLNTGEYLREEGSR